MTFVEPNDADQPIRWPIPPPFDRPIRRSDPACHIRLDDYFQKPLPLFPNNHPTSMNSLPDVFTFPTNSDRIQVPNMSPQKHGRSDISDPIDIIEQYSYVSSSRGGKPEQLSLHDSQSRKNRNGKLDLMTEENKYARFKVMSLLGEAYRLSIKRNNDNIQKLQQKRKELHTSSDDIKNIDVDIFMLEKKLSARRADWLSLRVKVEIRLYEGDSANTIITDLGPEKIFSITPI